MLIIHKSNLFAFPPTLWATRASARTMFRPRPRRGRDAASGRVHRNSASSRTRGRSIPRSFCSRFSGWAPHAYTHTTRTYRLISSSTKPRSTNTSRARARTWRRTEFLISLFAFSHARLIHACMRSRCINVENRGYAARLSECGAFDFRVKYASGERGRIARLAIYVKQRSRNIRIWVLMRIYMHINSVKSAEWIKECTGAVNSGIWNFVTMKIFRKNLLKRAEYTTASHTKNL